MKVNKRNEKYVYLRRCWSCLHKCSEDFLVPSPREGAAGNERKAGRGLYERRVASGLNA